MKFLKPVLIASFLTLLLTSPALAGDRVANIQAKIQSSIGQILPASDYLILVNRLDNIEDPGSNTSISGALKALPGLSVGVDEKGQVVRQDAQSGDYSGPVSISIILDTRVRAETRQMIKKNLPEMSGGLRDDDELKISETVLRQPPAQAQSSPVSVVNNNAPAQGTWSETMRFLALLLMTCGIFAWMLSRLMNHNAKPSPSPQSATPTPKSEDAEKEKAVKTDLAELDPRIVGLYLIKQLKDRKIDSLLAWHHLTTPSTQRKVLLTLPAWVAASMQTFLVPKKSPDGKKEEIPSGVAEKIYLDITVLEHSLKSQLDLEKAFLMWFPAQALRSVPRFQQKNFSSVARQTLWFFRPDLGDFVNVQDLPSTDVAVEPGFDQVHAAYEEMAGWTSSLFIGAERASQDPVQIWAQIVNTLQEFGPIDSQLKQAKEKLTPEQFVELKKISACFDTPFEWDETKVKMWLRVVDPVDYYWWKSMAKSPVTWDLFALLRPLRRAMFELGEKSAQWSSWSESEKKAASSRLLNQFRTVHIEGLEDSTRDIDAA